MDLINYLKSPQKESDVNEYKSYEIKRQNNHKEKEKIILKTIWEGHVYYNNNINGLLHCGAPLNEKHVTFIVAEDNRAFDDEVEIWILFIGKKSPQKGSIYKYDLHKITEKSKYLQYSHLETNDSI